MRKVVDFDIFSSVCPYFTSQYDVNNYYGCTHPEQTEICEDKNGIERGCCYCQSCPLGVAPDENDINNPEVDLDGLIYDDFVDENGDFIEDSGDYIIIGVGDGATEDKQIALRNYENYIYRYNKQEKEKRK